MLDNNQTPNPKMNPNKKAQGSKFGKRIIFGVVSVLILLLIAMGLLGYHYVQTSLKPLDATSKKVVEVHIPMGASNKKIASILQDKGVVKSGTVFNYYVQSHNYSDFRAGYYELKPSMTLSQIAKNLQKGGASVSEKNQYGKVLVREGDGISQIADMVAARTKYSRQDFLNLMKDEVFVKEVATEYPTLLKSAMAAKNVRYRLEGYLAPATYDVGKKDSLKSLVKQMVSQTNQVLKPYFAKIKKEDMSIQELMTLASLTENEGGSGSARRQIAGVFLNRLDVDMPIESDISVLYALNTHKKVVTNKDLKTKSPYNLYLHTGYGPGPFSSPSLDSIKAVLNPLDRSKNYLYFVANTKTGKIYFSSTYDQHLKYVKKLEKVNS
ncbi:endolytic transglycosylase MltG [Lactobacillus oryzae]|uniref:endolytic transglycosylase MltG n=1 Tax=Secundilactobacillus oryzae TaxID=1202668 RepID=UPI000551ABA2